MNNKYEVGEFAFYYSPEVRDLIPVQIEVVHPGFYMQCDYNVRIVENSICFDVWERELVNYTVLEPKPKECECGKVKHNFASHAQWCPVKE